MAFLTTRFLIGSSAVIAAVVGGSIQPAGAEEASEFQRRYQEARVLFTNTRYVEALLSQGETLWAATRGGIEAYTVRTRQRRRLYTTADGLDSSAVRSLALVNGRLAARTERSLCSLVGDRFRCVAAPPLPAPQPALAARFQGARVTARLAVASAGFDFEFIGTAGAGLFTADGTSWTPPNQICSNHVMALARFRGRIFFGSFDEGLCSYDGHDFRAAALPARMVNALAATPAGLYVATTNGLYRSVDGQSFERVKFVGAHGANGLAFDGQFLYVTTPPALYRLRIHGSAKSGDRVFWRPAGSSALQAVALASDAVWLASEDRGIISYRSGSFIPFDRAAGLPTSWMVDVAHAAGQVYAATLRYGLVRRQASGVVSAVSGLPDNWILRLIPDASGDGVWVGTQNGAAHLDGQGRLELLSGLPHPCVHGFLDLKEALWIATEGGTVYAPAVSPQIARAVIPSAETGRQRCLPEGLQSVEHPDAVPDLGRGTVQTALPVWVADRSTAATEGKQPAVLPRLPTRWAGARMAWTPSVARRR